MNGSVIRILVPVGGAIVAGGAGGVMGAGIVVGTIAVTVQMDERYQSSIDITNKDRTRIG